jgi:Arc/MetJ family transcription regulator
VKRANLCTLAAQKRAAVDLALRRLVGVPLTREFLLSLEGIGWGGDLDALRNA